MPTVSWTIDADGDWGTRADWTGGVVPGGTADVLLGSVDPHTVTHSTGSNAVHSITATTDRLAITGGTLKVLAGVSLDAGLALTGGTLAIGATSSIAGGLIASGGTLACGAGAVISIAGQASLSDQASLTGIGTLATTGATTVGGDGSSILIGGGVNWSNSGAVSVGGDVLANGAAHLVNAHGATFDLTADGAGITDDGGFSTFSNAGILAKTGGGGTSEIDSTLASTGTIAVASGVLELTKGGTIGGTVAGAGTLELGAASTAKLATLSGGGHILSAGLLQLAGKTVALGDSVVQQGGTLSLLTGATLTTSAELSLDDGAIVTGLATLATTGLTTVDADGSAIYLRGGLSWSNRGTVAAGGRILTLNATTLSNGQGASFDLTADGAGIINDGGSSSFNNAGTLAKTGGSGTSEIDFTLASTGTISVASGVLELTKGGTVSGAILGAGTLELGSGSTTKLANLSGGGVVLSTGLLQVAGSAVTMTADLIQQGGTLGLLTGATLTTSANLDLVGGAIVAGLATLSTTGVVSVGGDGSTVDLRGGLTWANSGSVAVAGGISTVNATTFVNLAGGSFAVAADGAGILAGGGASHFSNAGTLAKTGGGGTSEIDSTLTSTGTISLASGTLLLTAGATLSGLLTGAGTLELAGKANQVSGLSGIGGSDLLLNGGTTTLAGSALASLDGVQATLTVAGNDTVSADFAQTGGVIRIGGLLTLALDGAAAIEGGATIDGPGALATSGATALAADGSALTVDGGLAWSNRGTVTVLGAVQCVGTATVAISNAIGGAFDLNADSAGLVNSGGASTFANAGTLTKLAGSGTSVVGSALTSTGTIAVASGTLDLDGGGTISGAITGAGALLFGGGAFTIAAGTAVGIATLAVSGGSVTMGSGLAASLDMTGGSLTLAGGLSGPSALIGGGTLTLQAASNAIAGNFSVTGGMVALASGAVLTLTGPASLADGATIEGAATLATSGTVTLAADGSAASFGNGLGWTNSGSVTVFGQVYSAGVATMAFDNAPAGTFDLASDTAGIFDNGSISTFDNAGTLAKTGGSGTSSIYSSVDSTGTLMASSGTLALEFSASLAGTVGGSGGEVLLVNGANSSGQLAITDNGSAASVQLASSYASWNNSGTVADAGTVRLGDSGDSGPSIFYNAGGAVWDFTTDDGGLAAQGPVQVTNAGTLAKTDGSGSSVVAFGFANDGLIDAASGTLALQGAVSGTGQLRIEAGATLEMGHAVASSQTLTFDGTGATLRLDQPASVAGPIQGFGVGGGIDLAGTTITNASVSGNVLSVTAGSSTYTFTGAQSLAGLQAHVAGDGAGGSLVTLTQTSLDLALQDAGAMRLADLAPTPASEAGGPHLPTMEPRGVSAATGIWPLGSGHASLPLAFVSSH